MPQAPVHGRLSGFLTSPRQVLCGALLLIGFVAFLNPIADPDMWWHIRIGGQIIDSHSIPRTESFSYTAAGQPWTLHQWLFEAGIAQLDRWGGLTAVVLVVSLLAWTGLIAVLLRMRVRGLGPLATGLAVLFVAEMARPILGTRASALTFALVCWTLYIAERHLIRGGRLVFVLPPLFLFWANIHAGFIGGLGVLGLVLGAEVLRVLLHRGEAVPRRRVVELGVATLLGALVACINPAGPGLYPYVLTSTSWLRFTPIVEWGRPDIGNLGLLWYFAALVAVPVLLVWRRRTADIRDAVLALAGLGITWFAVRNVGLAAAMTAPVVVLWATPAPRRRPDSAARQSAPAAAGAVILGLVAAVVAVVVLAVPSQVAPAAVAREFPVCLGVALHGGPSHNIFLPYELADYIAGTESPTIRVFEYGEVVSLGQNVLDRYSDVISGDTEALRVLDDSHTDVVAAPSGVLDSLMVSAPGWRHAFDADSLHVYTRDGVTVAAPGCAVPQQLG